MTLPSALDVLLGLSIALALAAYVLRGLGLLSFVPGGAILLLFFFAAGTGVAWVLDKTR